MKGYDCIDGQCRCRSCDQWKPCDDFTPSASSRIRGHTLRCRSCSAEAAHTAYAETHPGAIRRRVKNPQVQCAWCGTAFTRTRDRSTYCSNLCRGRSRGKPDACRVHYGTCPHCGKVFTSPRAGRIYCSSECGWRYLYPRYLVQPRSANCIDCEAIYIQTDGHNLRCPRCVTDRRDALRHAAKARRRLRQRTNGPIEPISRRAVYERDDWHCYICGQQVHRKASATDPLSPTLDHVMPLALGGTHTMDNLRLACRRCNLEKSATFLVPPPTTSRRRRRRGMRISDNAQATDVGSSRVDLQACKLEYSIVSPK